jgi:hypothetical protein
VREAVDLSDLLKVLAARIEDFKDLLVVPRSVVSGVTRYLWIHISRYDFGKRANQHAF